MNEPFPYPAALVGDFDGGRDEIAAVARCAHLQTVRALFECRSTCLFGFMCASTCKWQNRT